MLTIRLLTVQSREQHGGWSPRFNLFVVGDTLEAILDIFEEDEAISEHFETAVRDLSRKCSLFTL